VPHVIPAWADLRREINTELPTALARISATDKGVLRRLKHQSRVKR